MQIISNSSPCLLTLKEMLVQLKFITTVVSNIHSQTTTEALSTVKWANEHKMGKSLCKHQMYINSTKIIQKSVCLTKSTTCMQPTAGFSNCTRETPCRKS